MRRSRSFRSLGFSHDCSVLHHKIDRAKRFDIGERRAAESDDVGANEAPGTAAVFTRQPLSDL